MPKRSRRNSRRSGGSIFSFIDGNYDDCVCDPETGKVINESEYSQKKDKSPSPKKDKSPSPIKNKSPSPIKDKTPSPEKNPSPLPTRTWSTFFFGQKKGGSTMKIRSRRRKSIRKKK